MATLTKTELRKDLLTKRNTLAPADVKRNSSMIRQRIFEHRVWKNAATILCYVSFGSEVETHILIQEALRFKKKVAVPIHDGTMHETPICELKRFAELGAGHRGVLQVLPEFRRIMDPRDIDLVLIPGIAFDKQGGRIGFGGGYFDRLLPKMPDAFRLGLAFNDQFTSAPLPLEAHDVRMQGIVSEKEFLEIKNI